MNKLQVQSITYDLQYFFTDRGLVKISIDENNINDKTFIDYNYKNLGLGVKLMKENIQMKFDMGLIDINQYKFSARKFLYESLDIFKPKYQINIIKEWENKYGKNLFLIKENTDRTDLRKIFENTWRGVLHIFKDDIINTLTEQKEEGRTWAQWAQGLVSSTWDSIKSTVSKAFTCAKGSDTIDCFMEGLRTIATSFLGIAVLTAVSFVPVLGNIPNFIIFGALLIYDLWKFATGKDYKVSDIVVDIVSILTPYIAKGIGKLLKGVTNFFGLGKLVGTNAILKVFVESLPKGIVKLTNIISKTIAFFSIKLGINWLTNMGNSANSALTKMKTEIEAGQKAANNSPEKTTKKTSQSKTTYVSNWNNYTCVKDNKELKKNVMDDGTIVYEGLGYLWFDDGRKYDLSTKEISEYKCDENNKIETEDLNKSDNSSKVSDVLTYKKCDNFPFVVGCINDKIKTVQKCFDLNNDGKFTIELENKLKDEGYNNTITKDIYDKILMKCGQLPDEVEVSSSIFSQEI